MARFQEATALRITNAVFFMLMVIANIVFEVFPLNNITVMEVSKANDTFLTPPGFTFAIWGVIYFGLLLFILYQFGLFNSKKDANNPDIQYAIGGLFIFTCLLNISWLIAWHYKFIMLSFLIIFTLWISLIVMYRLFIHEIRGLKDIFFVKFPFGIYISWITAAALVNFFALLRSLQPDLLNISESTWAIVSIAIIFCMTEFYIIKHKDYLYGLASIWVYTGLMFRYFDISLEASDSMLIFLLLALATVATLITFLIVGWLHHNESKMPQSTRNRNSYD